MLPLKIKVTKIKGKGRGKKLGIPTLNFAIPPDFNLSYGVYAGRLTTDKFIFPAAIHYGPRPVFDEVDPSLEVYVLDDLNEEITAGVLEFITFIREITNFLSPSEMVTQINKDVIVIKQALGSY